MHAAPPTFIKLTHATDLHKVYVNFSQVAYLLPNRKNETYIYFTDQHFVVVLEAPDHIVALIDQSAASPVAILGVN